MKYLPRILLLTLVALGCIFIAGQETYAAGEGGGDGGGESGCSSSGYWQCNGGTWTYAYLNDINWCSNGSSTYHFVRTADGGSACSSAAPSTAKKSTIEHACSTAGGFWFYGLMNGGTNFQQLLMYNQENSAAIGGTYPYKGKDGGYSGEKPSWYQPTSWQIVRDEYNTWGSQYAEVGNIGWNSNLVWFCAGAPASPKPNLGVWSGIYLVGDGTWKNTIAAAPGQTVHFGHSVNRSDLSKFDPDSVQYYLRESGNGPGSTGVSSFKYSQGTTKYINSASFNGSWNGGYDANIDGNYGGIDFTIPSNAKHGDTWCQQIYAQSNGAANTGWVNTSIVCAKAQVPPPPTNGGGDPTYDNGKVPPEDRNDNINGTTTNEDGNAAIVLDVKNNASNTASANKNWTTDGFQFSKITGVSGVTWSQTVYCATYDGDGLCTQWRYYDPVFNPAGGRPTVSTVNIPWQAGTYIWAKPQDSLTFRTLTGKQWTNVRGDVANHNIYADYGTCDISGIAGGASCTSVSNPEVSQNYLVPLSVVGTTVKQEATTNRTYAWQDNFHCHSFATVDSVQNKCTRADWQAPSAGGSGNSSASVKIPYNYTTEPKLDTNPPIETPGGGAVFPGEQMNITSTIDIEKKNNTPVSTDEYATQTKPTVYEVITFMATPTSGKPTRYGQTESATGSTYYTSTPGSGSSCSYYTSASGFAYYSPRSDGKPNCNVEARFTDIYNDSLGINDTFSLGGRTTSLWGGTINIDDAPIGTKFCIAVSVWPADSHNGAAASTGSASDPSMTTGTGYWQHTPPQCFDIAKKPNMQVWGSSIFANGSITTSQSNKKQADNSYRLFGSWSEYATISRSSISGFGTGAAFGYELNNGGNFAKSGGMPNGGSASTCNYSKATVTNTNCNSLGGANIGSGSVAVTTARLLARYASPTGKNVSGTTSLTSLDGKYYINGDIHITSSVTIPKGKTIVIYATGNIYIDGNIIYNDGPYSNISDLPQVLLFGQNIYISENVDRVDAWLIAGRQGGTGIVDTCYGFSIGSMGANNCNKQLTINGPIFSNKLVTKRTAGAGTGNASIDPSEIFNLRPDSYLWAMAQAQGYKQAVSTNLKNLPPRY